MFFCLNCALTLLCHMEWQAGKFVDLVKCFAATSHSLFLVGFHTFIFLFSLPFFSLHSFFPLSLSTSEKSWKTSLLCHLFCCELKNLLLFPFPLLHLEFSLMTCLDALSQITFRMMHYCIETVLNKKIWEKQCKNGEIFHKFYFNLKNIF